jgi:tetratricopeptide (TPR) repeat protein
MVFDRQNKTAAGMVPFFLLLALSSPKPAYAQFHAPNANLGNDKQVDKILSTNRSARLIADRLQKKAMRPLQLSTATPMHSSEDEPALKDNEDLEKGKMLLQADKPEESVAYFQAFVKANPESAQAYFYLGTAFSETDKFDDAINALEKAISLANKRGYDSAQFHVNLGNCYLQRDRVDDAITQFHTAEQIMPNESRAHLNMARAYLEKANPVYAELAINELNKVEGSEIDARLVPLLKARSLELLGKPEDAAKELHEYSSTYLKKPEDAAERQKIERLVANLKPRKTTKLGPTAPDKRRYEIKSGDMYIIFDIDEDKNLVTLATGDNKDPDGGAQDGENDGLITMPLTTFMAQVKESTIYRHEEKNKEAQR